LALDHSVVVKALDPVWAFLLVYMARSSLARRRCGKDNRGGARSEERHKTIAQLRRQVLGDFKRIREIALGWSNGLCQVKRESVDTLKARDEAPKPGVLVCHNNVTTSPELRGVCSRTGASIDEPSRLWKHFFESTRYSGCVRYCVLVEKEEHERVVSEPFDPEPLAELRPGIRDLHPDPPRS
jgi:hypothetical protein